MDSVDAQTRRALADIASVDRLAGAYVGRSGQRALVDIGGGRIPVDFCGYLPELTEPVWVEFLNGRALLIGPTRYKPDRGTFVSSNSGLAQVDTDAGRVVATFALGQAFSVGQVVKLMWQGGPHIVSVMSTQPTPPRVPEAPSSGSKEKEQQFRAIDSGSYRSGRWWTNDVWYAQNNTPGAWFHGSTIADTIPDDAAILAIAIWVRVTEASGSAPQFGTHDFGTKPGGGFGISNKQIFGQVGDGYAGFVDLPTSFGDRLKTGGGIGTDGAGLRVFAGTNQDGMSGTISIKWREN